MLRQQHRFFRSVLIGSDLALVVAAGVAAYGLRFYVLAGVLPPAGGAESHAYSTYAIPMEFAAPIMMLALLSVGQYRPRRDERFYLEAGTIVKGVAIGLGATIVTLGMFQNILFGGRHYSGIRDEWAGCMQRQNVKPGITGWALVNGHRGHTSLRKRLQYDLFYIRNWSIMFDMRILWMTLFRGFANPHAN